MCDGECIPAVYSLGNKAGKHASAARGIQISRRELIKRDGPPPSPDKNICRHTCKNDSMAKNGFVCTLHTIWGTHTENMNDKSEEDRATGGKITGKKNAESGHLQRICSEGGKTGGKISGKITGSIERTCPHCGKTMKGPVYFHWHGDNCKSRAASFKDYIEGEEDDKH